MIKQREFLPSLSGVDWDSFPSTVFLSIVWSSFLLNFCFWYQSSHQIASGIGDTARLLLRERQGWWESWTMYVWFVHVKGIWARCA